MKKIIIKIYELIVDMIFPSNESAQKDDEVTSDIAKLAEQEGDKIIKYPCPAYSFFAYRNPNVRQMIWRLKYRGDIKVAETFAGKMYDQFCEELAELGECANFKEPILVAIPVSKHKLRLRGFNQSVALCKALAKVDENRFFTYTPNVLYKIKDTQSQARVKDRQKRLQNLKDSFAIKDIGLVANKNIILLDDVLTTGATLSEATKVLKNAGAKSVIWIVIAH